MNIHRFGVEIAILCLRECLYKGFCTPKRLLQLIKQTSKKSKILQNGWFGSTTKKTDLQRLQDCVSIELRKYFNTAAKWNRQTERWELVK